MSVTDRDGLPVVVAGERLVLGDDRGGWRQFLDGKPINCGRTLELAGRVWKSKRDDFGEVHEWSEWDGTWHVVRYEVEFRKVGRVPVMYGTVGGYTFTADITDEHRFRWPERDS